MNQRDFQFEINCRVSTNLAMLLALVDMLKEKGLVDEDELSDRQDMYLKIIFEDQHSD
jgi:hypothetical protein